MELGPGSEPSFLRLESAGAAAACLADPELKDATVLTGRSWDGSRLGDCVERMVMERLMFGELEKLAPRAEAYSVALAGEVGGNYVQ